MRPRPGKSRILPASPTDLRTLVENFIYPLIVCEAEGKIVFFNGAAQDALPGEELAGHPVPQEWMDREEVEIETSDQGLIPFRLFWEEIMWDGNVGWYLTAIPAVGRDVEAEAEVERLRSELEKLQETATEEQNRLREQLEEAERQAGDLDEARVRLEKSQELAAAEVDELRARYEQSQELAGQEVEQLRARLEEIERSAAEELEELKTKLEEARNEAEDAESLRAELDKSAELVAVEVERRLNSETERENLEAKLRDLHQRSLSKLEAAKAALDNERLEREELAERMAELNLEAETLRVNLDEKSVELEEFRNQSGEQFNAVSSELEERGQALQQREEELAAKSREIAELQERLSRLEQELEQKAREFAYAEDTAERFKREYEELDREMMAVQEQTALLQAKLKSAESRMERYKRLMDKDPAEFASSGNAEREIERLQAQIEDLKVELAAATAAAARPEQSEADPEALKELEQECQSLKDGLRSRESRIQELEEALAAASSGEGSSDTAPDTRLSEAKSLIEELRFHKELEYQEAQASLRHLQQEFAQVRANGAVAESVDSEETTQLEERLVELEGSLQDARLELERTKDELLVKVEVAQSVPLLREKVQLLEERLHSAESSATGEPSPELVARLQELEAELEKARGEASPEELQLARRRISELEAQVASGSQSHAPGTDGELLQKNQQLEKELAKTREQLAEINQELKRTLEGDRETKKLAYADQLTGLPNLNLTGQYLQVCFERSGRGEGALALILIDLDHFRRVNDALGQKSGDELLREVGGRLQRCVTEKDTAIARRGEDEFMVVAFMEQSRVDGEALQARVRGIAHNLLNELAKPFDILDQQVQVTASLGVALYPGPADSRTELLEQAEHAMYKAKETGRARVSFYTEEMHSIRERRRFLETELRQAVAQRQFGLVYQPIYEIASSKVVGIEALLRWSHPTRGVLEPGEFLAAAEETGIIVQIGEQIISEALEVAKQKFMKRRFLTMNLSFRQLIDSGFSARFMKHLQLAGVPPHEVIVEISEKAANIDPDRIKNTLAHLAHWGVGIALDDFGSGSSEINHLTEYTLRVVKIDGALVGRMPDDRSATKLCQAITQMASALEIPVLAEGVENREQLKLIAGMGCQYAQGLVLGGPMNVNQLVQVL